MPILNYVTHYPATNSVEAAWADADGVQIKCQSYADVQMDMLESDLGADAAAHAALIAAVRANIKPIAPSQPYIPSLVSMRQARLALLQSGLLAQVNAAIAVGSEADKITWEYATEVRRGDALVAGLSAALGLSASQLDDLFTLAVTL